MASTCCHHQHRPYAPLTHINDSAVPVKPTINHANVARHTRPGRANRRAGCRRHADRRCRARGGIDRSELTSRDSRLVSCWPRRTTMPLSAIWSPMAGDSPVVSTSRTDSLASVRSVRSSWSAHPLPWLCSTAPTAWVGPLEKGVRLAIIYAHSDVGKHPGRPTDCTRRVDLPTVEHAQNAARERRGRLEARPEGGYIRNP